MKEIGVISTIWRKTMRIEQNERVNRIEDSHETSQEMPIAGNVSRRKIHARALGHSLAQGAHWGAEVLK